jgi:hypothetical protein
MGFSREYVKDNNGRLVVSTRFLKIMGWNSSDILHRVILEFVKAELIYEAIKGHRPNNAG